MASAPSDAPLLYSRAARAWLGVAAPAAGRGRPPNTVPQQLAEPSTSASASDAAPTSSCSADSVNSAGIGARPHRQPRPKNPPVRPAEAAVAAPHVLPPRLHPPPPPPPPPPPAPPLTPADHAWFLEAERLLAGGRGLARDAARRHERLAQAVAAARAAWWCAAWDRAATTHDGRRAALDPATAAAAASTDRRRAGRVSAAWPRAWRLAGSLPLAPLVDGAAAAVAGGGGRDRNGRGVSFGGVLSGGGAALPPLRLAKPGSLLVVPPACGAGGAPPTSAGPPPLHRDPAARQWAAATGAAVVVAAPALLALAGAAVEARPPPGWEAEDWTLPVVVEGGVVFVSSPLPRRAETLREASARAAKAALVALAPSPSATGRAPTYARWVMADGTSLIVRSHDRGLLGDRVPPAPGAALAGGGEEAREDGDAADATGAPAPPPPPVPASISVTLQYGSAAEADREEEAPAATARLEAAAGLRGGWGGALAVAHVSPAPGGLRLLRWRRLDGAVAAGRGGVARPVGALAALLGGLAPFGPGTFLISCCPPPPSAAGGGGGGEPSLAVYAALAPPAAPPSLLPPLPLGLPGPGDAAASAWDLWAAAAAACSGPRRPAARGAPPVWRPALPGQPQVPHTPPPAWRGRTHPQKKQGRKQQSGPGGGGVCRAPRRAPPLLAAGRKRKRASAAARLARCLPSAWTTAGVEDWDAPAGWAGEEAAGGPPRPSGNRRSPPPPHPPAATLLDAAAAEL